MDTRSPLLALVNAGSAAYTFPPPPICSEARVSMRTSPTWGLTSFNPMLRSSRSRSLIAAIPHRLQHRWHGRFHGDVAIGSTLNPSCMSLMPPTRRSITAILQHPICTRQPDAPNHEYQPCRQRRSGQLYGHCTGASLHASGHSDGQNPRIVRVNPLRPATMMEAVGRMPIPIWPRAGSGADRG